MSFRRIEKYHGLKSRATGLVQEKDVLPVELKVVLETISMSD